MASTITLYPIPGTYQGRPLIAYISARRFDPLESWPHIKAWAAWQFEASADEIDTHEVYFGGEYGDDDSREVLTVKGDIVGVFDKPLDESGWRKLLTADSFQNPRPAPSLSNQVREAARARVAIQSN